MHIPENCKGEPICVGAKFFFLDTLLEIPLGQQAG